MKQTERNQAQPRTLQLPPAWCRAVCTNSMNEICLEICAIKRDCSGFELKKEIQLEDMPRFPVRELSDMRLEEQLTSIAIYLAKVVDRLKGNEK